MALAIRFSRIGMKHKPVYRVIVQNHENHPQKKYIEVLGHFYPFNQQLPGTPKFQCQADRVQYWISQGAKCSDRVSHLLKENGMFSTTSPQTAPPPTSQPTPQ